MIKLTQNLLTICRVLTAMPIESKAEIDGPTACLLMDEEDRNRKVNKVTGKDGALKVVGWYHSHPSFPARPTTIDIYNQVLEQQQASPEEGFPVTPFVGAIVSPYDDTEPKKDIAEIFWYYAELPTSFEGVAQGQSPVNSGVIPRALKVRFGVLSISIPSLLLRFLYTCRAKSTWVTRMILKT